MTLVNRWSPILFVSLAATLATAGGARAETSHPLEFVLESGAGEAGLLVTASVHNPTSKRVFLQITTPEVFAVSADLTHADGTPVEGMHTWATRGKPFMDHRFHELPAGGSLALDSFAIRDDQSLATGGGWRWDLRQQRGQTLRLTFSFTQDCDGRTTDPPSSSLLHSTSARPKKLKDIFCGELVSPPLEVAVPPWTRDNVLSTLLREPVLDEDAYDILVDDALTHGTDAVRENAVYSLGEIARPAAAVPLAPLLGDPDREVRGYTARALGSLKNREALPALKAALEKEQDDWVRGAIFRAIEALEP